MEKAGNLTAFFKTKTFIQDNTKVFNLYTITVQFILFIL